MNLSTKLILRGFLTFLLLCGLTGRMSPAFGGDSAPESSGGTIIRVEDTIQATLRTHRSLKSIQENREAVAHELDRAEAFYGPRLDVTGGIGIGKVSNSTSRSQNLDKHFYPSTNISATLTQPLYDGFATRSRVRNAQATLDSMTHRVFDNATTLSLDSIIAHIDVMRQRETVRLAEENVARHEATLVQARDREILGADTMADVTQAESRLARALSTLVESRTSLLNSEENYRRLTGMSPSYDLVAVELPLRLYSGTSEVMEDAKRFNPKLAAYIKDVMAARGNKELAASAFHPAINFEMGPRYSDRESSGNEWTHSFDVMTTMRWNVLNSGADLAASRAAEARVRQARQFMYNYVDDMALEIETTWNAYTSAQDQYQHYMDAIQFNTTTRDAYQEQFLIGQRSLLDVLDADSELFSSSTQALTAHGNILISSYRLLALAGVLLPSLNIDTATLYTAPEDAPVEPRERF